MRYIVVVLFFSIVSNAHSLEKKSVLFISIDDLNDWNEVLKGHPQAITPNIKRIADMGTTFTRAICSSPVCFPSRTAVFSGVHPANSGVISNFNWDRHWRTYLPNAVTLPKHFRNNGWRTYSGGKTFHNSHGRKEFEFYYGRPADPRPIKETFYKKGPIGWGVSSKPYEEMSDYKVASWAVKQIEKSKDPSFFAFGLYKPHVNWILPQSSFDKYPIESFQLPESIEGDLNDIPERFKLLAHNEAKFGKGYHQKLKDDKQTKLWARAYMASVTFADEQLGRILDAWEKSEHSENGIVVLWSDHGFMLGEKEGWGKFKPWFDAIHTNLIIAGPGIAKGEFCTKAVSLQDLYPTLIDLVDIAGPDSHKLDGNSLKELLKNPSTNWDKPVVMSHEEDGIRYDVVLNNEYRMTRAITGETELYNSSNDPHEFNNLSNKQEYKEVIEELEKHLTFKLLCLPDNGRIEAEEIPRQTSADFRKRGNYHYFQYGDNFSKGRSITAGFKMGSSSYIDYIFNVDEPAKYDVGAGLASKLGGSFQVMTAKVSNDQNQATANTKMDIIHKFILKKNSEIKNVKFGVINFNSPGKHILRIMTLGNKRTSLSTDFFHFKKLKNE